ncbi:MAG: glutamate racemase [Chitinophagaceae bacterium]
MSVKPIGIFDSGYGGLTIMKEIAHRLPSYDYLYLGDNARSPYGTRSFETVYQYTLECVRWLFSQGCHLVILACNTASAKALRTIQQNDLPSMGQGRRVLGVIRPTTEIIGNLSQTGAIGIFATPGTVHSGSYPLEIQKFYPQLQVFQEACPMWVPLIENNEHQLPGADYFVRQHLENLLHKSQGKIDTILLACTHYPLLMKKIREFLPGGIKVVSQGSIIADSLADYLMRHPEMEANCSNMGDRSFFTTDSTTDFDTHASLFFGAPVFSRHVSF